MNMNLKVRDIPSAKIKMATFLSKIRNKFEHIGYYENMIECKEKIHGLPYYTDIYRFRLRRCQIKINVARMYIDKLINHYNTVYSTGNYVLPPEINNMDELNTFVTNNQNIIKLISKITPDEHDLQIIRNQYTINKNKISAKYKTMIECEEKLNKLGIYEVESLKWHAEHNVSIYPTITSQCFINTINSKINQVNEITTEFNETHGILLSNDNTILINNGVNNDVNNKDDYEEYDEDEDNQELDLFFPPMETKEDIHNFLNEDHWSYIFDDDDASYNIYCDDCETDDDHCTCEDGGFSTFYY